MDVTGSPQTPLQSPVPPARSLDEEQFEPILSDEDIVDESDSQVRGWLCLIADNMSDWDDSVLQITFFRFNVK